MGYIIYLMSVLLAVFICHSCINDSENTHQKLSNLLGNEAISKIQSEEEITIVPVLPKTKFNSPEDLQTAGIAHTLNENDRNELLHLLLNDQNYQFDAVKKCIFIPDYLIQFGADGEVVILVSTSCNQCKFYFADDAKLVGYNLAKERMTKFFKNFQK